MTRRSSAAKATRLAPVIEQVMARKPKVEVEAEVDDYSFKAYIRQLADDSGDQAMAELVDRYAEERAAGRPDTLLNS